MPYGSIISYTQTPESKAKARRPNPPGGWQHGLRSPKDKGLKEGTLNCARCQTLRIPTAKGHMTFFIGLPGAPVWQTSPLGSIAAGCGLLGTSGFGHFL